jgi:steroid 5-alpha reductase family enzyme
MALPLVKTLPECADFSKTVRPFLPQLYDLPYKIIERINDFEALQHLYVSTNPLVTSFAFAMLVSVIVFVVSEINRNYSQVDRLWSLLPVIYNVHYDLWAHLNGLPASRVDHVMALSVIWGARLTFNYWRKGGYQVGSEDYRWNIVKDYIGPVPMFILNVVFISLAQNVSRLMEEYSSHPS